MPGSRGQSPRRGSRGQSPLAGVQGAEPPEANRFQFYFYPQKLASGAHYPFFFLFLFSVSSLLSFLSFFFFLFSFFFSLSFFFPFPFFSSPFSSSLFFSLSSLFLAPFFFSLAFKISPENFPRVGESPTSPTPGYATGFRVFKIESYSPILILAPWLGYSCDQSHGSTCGTGMTHHTLVAARVKRTVGSYLKQVNTTKILACVLLLHYNLYQNNCVGMLHVFCFLFVLVLFIFFSKKLHISTNSNRDE